MVVPLVVSCCVDYWFGKRLAPGSLSDTSRARYLTAALTLNVALLAYFKYMNFFVAEWNRALCLFGQAPVQWTDILLPIGISFFTFHKVSYLVDVYRGTVRQAKRLADYALYVVFFPQLVAGPIIRYADVAHEIVRRESTQSLFLAGSFRFIVGLSKKVLIADAMGTVADAVFAIGDYVRDRHVWVGAIPFLFPLGCLRLHGAYGGTGWAHSATHCCRR